MAANERSSGGSSFVRLVTPFIYYGFTKGSLPALGPHAPDAHTTLSHTHKHVGALFTRGMAGPLLLRADRGLQVLCLELHASKMLLAPSTFNTAQR